MCFQGADGHVPGVLNDGETEKVDWDVYVRNTDYNAYAAAMLSGDRPSRKAYTTESNDTRVPAIQYASSCCST